MEDVMTGSCQEMNDAICGEIDERSVSHMGTTLAAYYFRDGKAWALNVGDSKCLRFRDGALEQLSVDHTDEETMKMNGVTGRKPFITQYLGIRSEDMSICPSFMKDEVRDGDMYLICSDGLTDMLPSDEIAEILCEEGDEEEKVQALLVGALKNGGRDNITVILCRVYE
jgi:protein phosphatase